MAAFDGSMWSSETITSVTGSGSSLVVDPVNGVPMVAYSSSGVQFAWKSGSGWNTEVVATGFGSFNSVSLQIDPLTGQPCVAYSDTFDGAYFARRMAGGIWLTEQVESLSFPHNTVLEFNPVTGRPGLAYQTSSGAPVRYAEFDGTSWNTTQVSASGHTCWDQVGLAYLEDGSPVVAYTAGAFSSEPVLEWGFYLAMEENGSFDVVSQHSYGDYNWNGPVDLEIEKELINVAYYGTNVGTHIASMPEPTAAGLLGVALAAIVAGGIRRRKCGGETRSKS